MDKKINLLSNMLQHVKQFFIKYASACETIFFGKNWFSYLLVNLVIYLKIRDYEVIEYNCGYLFWFEYISYRLGLLDRIFYIECLYLDGEKDKSLAFTSNLRPGSGFNNFL